MKNIFAFQLLCLALTGFTFTGCNDSSNGNHCTYPPMLTFKIEISNLTRHSADVMITPSELHTKYLYFIIDKAQYDEIGSDEALLEKSRQELIKRAEQEGKTLAQLADEIRRIGAFARPETFSGLEIGTAYYIYAYGIDDNGEAISVITKQEFTTESVQMVECLFNLKIETTRTSINIDVKPTDKTQWYYYQLLTEPQFNSYGGTAEKAAAAVVKKQIDAWLALGAESTEKAVESMALKGDHSYNFTGLTPDTQYYIFICGINGDGDICTKVEEIKIRTDKFEPSDNNFGVYVSAITCDSATIEIITDNDDPYLAVVKPQSEIKGNGNEEIMAAAVAEMGEYVGKYAKKGKQTIACNRTLMPDTDYSVLVFGYDGGVTTALTRVDFKTLEASTSGDVTFTFSFTKAGYTVAPSDDSALYLQGAIREQDYQSYGSEPARLKEYLKAIIDIYVPDIYSMDEYLKAEGKRGTYTDTDGFLNGNYYIYAICVNADGTFAGEMSVSEMHTF